MVKPGVQLNRGGQFLSWGSFPLISSGWGGGRWGVGGWSQVGESGEQKASAGPEPVSQTLCCWIRSTDPGLSPHTWASVLTAPQLAFAPIPPALCSLHPQEELQGPVKAPDT